MTVSFPVNTQFLFLKKHLLSLYRITAKDKAFLKRMSINYVLNTAEGKRFTQVDTDHLYYRDCPGMRYKGFQLMDLPSTDISKYFYIAANFIDEGLSSGGTYDCIYMHFA